MNRIALAITATLAALAPSLAHAETDEPTHRSPTAAFAIAASSTAAGLALSIPVVDALASAPAADRYTLGFVGLAFAVTAPAAGHIYAGEYKRALITSGLRAGGALAVMGGMDSFQIDGEGGNELALGVAAAGAAVIAATTIYDLYDAPKAARRTNARQLVLAPTALPAKDGVAPAFAIAGSF